MKKKNRKTFPNPREDEEIVFIQLKKNGFRSHIKRDELSTKDTGHHTPLNQKSSSFH